MIPEWNSVGLIPPIRPGEPGHSSDRAPYEVDLLDVITKFAITEERCNILRGFLNFRNALHNIGLTEGFQWLDGSFMEDIERRESRPPGDIDVVTFGVIPPNETQMTLYTNHQPLFTPSETKDTYNVDAYFMEINNVSFLDWRIQKVSYWYSMWAHTRNDEWKGFVTIDLSPNSDVRALEMLEDLTENFNEGGI